MSGGQKQALWSSHQLTGSLSTTSPGKTNNTKKGTESLKKNCAAHFRWKKKLEAECNDIAIVLVRNKIDLQPEITQLVVSSEWEGVDLSN